MGFEGFNLNENILKAVAGLGFKEPTPIQEKCIPLINEGKDVVGQSLTGSGKTAAFGLPILNRIQKGKGLQALVLTPTRELCVQVRDAISEFGYHMQMNVSAVYGGVGIEPQISAIRTSEIVVGTPGRILDHLQRRTIDLRGIRFLVIDEADKMFEMGFIEDVEKIIGQTQKGRQTLLFSATMYSSVLDLVKKHLRDPVVVREQVYVDRSLLRQIYYEVPLHDKFSLLVHLLKNKTPGLAIVFCGTRREVDIISRNIALQGIKTLAVHGGLSQNKRSFAVNSLKEGEIPVLVATDVAARGLDISNISHIYNYDVPKSSQDYVHRIGRTARAGHKGDAVTLLTERDHDNFRRVLSDSTIQIAKLQLPDFDKIKFNTGRDRRGSFRPHSDGGFRGRPRFGRARQTGSGERVYSRERSDNDSFRRERPEFKPPRFGNAG